MEQLSIISWFGKRTHIFWVIFSITVLNVSSVCAEASSRDSKDLSIKIHQPPFNQNWASQLKFTANDDLVIEVNGKICGKADKASEERFHPVRTGVDTSTDYSSYTAKVFRNGKGYVLVKNFNGWEDVGISEVWLVQYEFKNECYVEKKIHFSKKINGLSIVEDCSENGCFGDLLVSNDGKFILVIRRERVLKAPKNVNSMKMGSSQTGTKTSYCVYSVKTFKQVDSGAVTDGTDENGGLVKSIVIRGVKYELFGDWFKKLKSN